MKPFCEVIVAEILPTIRMLITKHLLESYDYTQTKVASILGITQAAVSQYSTAARGKRLKLIEKNKKIMELIEKLADDIAKGKVKSREVHVRLCELCREIRKSKLICKLHEDSYPTLAPCDYCLH
jgi:hypothetical protein